MRALVCVLALLRTSSTSEIFRVGRTGGRGALGSLYSQNSQISLLSPSVRNPHGYHLFLSQKDRDHDLSSGKRTLKLLRTWGFYMAQLCRLPLGFGFIMVETGFFFLENLGQKPYPSVPYWGTRFLSLFLYVQPSEFVGPKQHRPCSSCLGAG